MTRSILDVLGRKHGTDKASGSHNYHDWYHGYLQRLRDEPIKLLEIGVGDGASLRMWRDYFHRGHIVGMDLREDRKELFTGDQRIAIEIGNSGVDNDLHRVAEAHFPFDVIVDDGGHDPQDQILAYHVLMDYMRPGGFYILEDVGGQH